MKSIDPLVPVAQETEKEEELVVPVVIVQLFVMVKSIPLSVPIVKGSSETTRIL